MFYTINNTKGGSEMKGKVLILIIGLLVGAVIMLFGFLVYQNANKNTNQMPNGSHANGVLWNTIL